MDASKIAFTPSPGAPMVFVVWLAAAGAGVPAFPRSLIVPDCLPLCNPFAFSLLVITKGGSVCLQLAGLPPIGKH